MEKHCYRLQAITFTMKIRPWGHQQRQGNNPPTDNRLGRAPPHHGATGDSEEGAGFASSSVLAGALLVVFFTVATW